MTNKVEHKYITGKSAVKIAESIERALQSGRLGPNEKLPAVRALADRLGVSTATVAAAYKSLQVRGLLIGEGRRGTRTGPRVGAAARQVAPIPPGVRDLSYGNPDPGLLPTLEGVLERIDPAPRLYVNELVHPALRKAAEAAFAADGIPVSAVGVVGGAFDGIERVLRARLRAGDRVGVEDPGFTGVFDLLTSLNHSLVPIDVDDQGFVPAAFEAALKKGVRALVYTPRAQNPFGAALTEKRATSLRRILARFPEVILVEDDHAGAISGEPAVTLTSADREFWAVIRSVSKALGPDLRLATMTGDPLTMERVLRRQNLGMRWVSHIIQQIAADFLNDAGVRKLMRRAARTYAERRAGLMRELQRQGIASFGRSGFNVWIPVDQEAEVCQGLLGKGWAVRAGEGFRLESPPAIRVTTSTLDPEDAGRFAADLAGLIRPRGAITFA